MKFKNILSLIAIAAVTLPGFTSCLGDNKDDDPNSQHSISSLYIEQSKNMVVAAPVSGSGEVQTLPGCRILLRVDNNDRTLAMSVADFQYDAQSRAEAFDYPAIPVTVNNNGFTANNATSVSCRGLYSTLEISNFHAEFKTRENGMQNLVALNFVVNNKNRISIEFVNNEYKGVTSSSQLQQSSSITFSTREPNYLITFDRASKTLSITIDKPIFTATSPLNGAMVIAGVPYKFTPTGYEFAIDEVVPKIGGKTDDNMRISSLTGTGVYGSSLNLSFDCYGINSRVTFSGNIY